MMSLAMDLKGSIVPGFSACWLPWGWASSDPEPALRGLIVLPCVLTPLAADPRNLRLNS